MWVSNILLEIKSHNPCQSTAGAALPLLPETDSIFGQVWHKVGRTDRVTVTFHLLIQHFFHLLSCESHLHYHITVVWFCSSAIVCLVVILLWEIFRICFVVRLWTPSKHHIPVQCCQHTITHRHRFALVVTLLLPLLMAQLSPITPLTFIQMARHYCEVILWNILWYCGFSWLVLANVSLLANAD